MKAVSCARMFARIFLVAGFGVALFAGPASAQKQGGSITVGLELDIPGFDPLKVGVFDTAAETAAAAIFDTLIFLDDKGQPQPKLALSWTHSDDSELEQCCAIANGVEDQGRRLQSQSRRYRALHPEIMDRGRPHGSRKES